jgi:ankyrin repeat protein
MVTRRRDFTAALSAVLLLTTTLATASDLRVVEAMQQGNREEVRALIKKRADVNQPQPDGATALQWAAYQDDLESADLLIRARAKVNAANDYGNTPLWLACANGSDAMVDKLLKARANANAAQWSGATPLMMCARTGNVHAVESLLKHGAQVNSFEAEQNQTALMWAAAGKNPAPVVAALIAHGGDVNAHTKGGFTPLMFAAQQGDLETARALLNAGAAIDARTGEQAMWVDDTPLLIASASGHEELSIFLLEKGANANAVDDFGYGALHFALMSPLSRLTAMRLPDFGWSTYIYRPNMTGLVKALLAHGADPNVRIAKRWGGNKLLSVLFNDPEKFSVNEVGMTPFLVAAMSHDLTIMRMLVAAGADPSLSSFGGTTPLMIASGVTRRRCGPTGGGSAGRLPPDEAKQALEVVKYLVEEQHADVNAVNNHHMTALFGAAFHGSNDIVSYLVAKGADVNVRDLADQTPLDKALNIEPKPGISTLGDGHQTYIPYTYWKDTADLLVSLGGKSTSKPTTTTTVAAAK